MRTYPPVTPVPSARRNWPLLPAPPAALTVLSGPLTRVRNACAELGRHRRGCRTDRCFVTRGGEALGHNPCIGPQWTPDASSTDPLRGLYRCRLIVAWPARAVPCRTAPHSTALRRNGWRPPGSLRWAAGRGVVQALVRSLVSGGVVIAASRPRPRWNSPSISAAARTLPIQADGRLTHKLT